MNIKQTYIDPQPEFDIAVVLEDAKANGLDISRPMMCGFREEDIGIWVRYADDKDIVRDKMGHIVSPSIVRFLAKPRHFKQPPDWLLEYHNSKAA